MDVPHRGTTTRKVRLRVERISAKIYEHITAILCIIALHRKKFTKNRFCIHRECLLTYEKISYLHSFR